MICERTDLQLTFDGSRKPSHASLNGTGPGFLKREVPPTVKEFEKEEIRREKRNIHFSHGNWQSC